MAAHNPQIFYKSLFALSAATQSDNVSSHLQVVQALSCCITPAVYWTHADPQMVVIVLMGDPTARPNKGKGREGEKGVVSVKLGRYAVLVEVLRAVKAVEDTAGPGTRLRTWIEAVEVRLAVMLEAEVCPSSLRLTMSLISQEKERELPVGYRTLLCQLLSALRLKTLSLRKYVVRT